MEKSKSVTTTTATKKPSTRFVPSRSHRDRSNGESSKERKVLKEAAIGEFIQKSSNTIYNIQR
jgi:hypothetical protein